MKTISKKFKILSILISLLISGSFSISCKTQVTMTDKTVVQHLDIQKYLGTWYEIARYDHKFERGLVGVTATYSMRDDGMIKVINRGFKGTLDGKPSEAVGKAKIPDPSVPSRLKVSFFLFFYGDYYVLELDQDYRWAVVGSSSDNYLWILSRTPQMDESLYRQILDKLVKRGYNVEKLIKVPQRNN